MAATLLDNAELGALLELVKLGVGRAAGALREMVGASVTVATPNIKLVSYDDAIRIYGEDSADYLVAVRQSFSGDITGSALLIFSRGQAQDLTRLLVGAAPGENVDDMESEAIAETGNILLNGYLGTIANMLLRNLATSLPQLARGTAQAIFTELAPSPPDGLVISQCINLAVKGRDIQVDLLTLTDVPSLSVLKVLLSEFMQRASAAGVAVNGR